MIAKHAVSQVPKTQANKGFMSQLFSVSKKDGGMRPTINLKGLNTIVKTVRFEMEGIHMLKDILKPGDWMTKIYLKDAYNILHDFSASASQMPVEISVAGVNLPVSLAPLVFIKTMRPVTPFYVHRQHTDHGSLNICSE